MKIAFSIEIFLVSHKSKSQFETISLAQLCLRKQQQRVLQSLSTADDLMIGRVNALHIEI